MTKQSGQNSKCLAEEMPKQLPIGNDYIEGGGKWLRMKGLISFKVKCLFYYRKFKWYGRFGGNAYIRS